MTNAAITENRRCQSANGTNADKMHARKNTARKKKNWKLRKASNQYNEIIPDH